MPSRGERRWPTVEEYGVHSELKDEAEALFGTAFTFEKAPRNGLDFEGNMGTGFIRSYLTGKVSRVVVIQLLFEDGTRSASFFTDKKEESFLLQMLSSVYLFDMPEVPQYAFENLPNLQEQGEAIYQISDGFTWEASEASLDAVIERSFQEFKPVANPFLRRLGLSNMRTLSQPESRVFDFIHFIDPDVIRRVDW